MRKRLKSDYERKIGNKQMNNMLLACFEKVQETHPPFRLLKVQHKMLQQANKQINYSTNLHR